jgi:hypothetical protein
MSQLSVAQAIYTALTGSTPLMAKVTGVYDVVPKNTAGPYIAIGQLQSLRGRLLSDNERAWYADIHIWSSYQGRKEVLEIADLISPVIPPGWFAEELTVIQDPSGWYHGVLTIKGYDR